MLSNIHYITVTVKVNLLLWSAKLIEVFGPPANRDPRSFILLLDGDDIDFHGDHDKEKTSMERMVEA